MNAEIVTTGTELLLGVISDTNSTYIARRLRDIGLNLYFITSAGDNQERVAHVIDAALNRSDVVITTGGLGPTVDDITREAVAQATGRELVLDEGLVASIEAFFARRGFHMSTNNRRQACIPAGAIPLENPVGTAPCFIVEDPRGVVISLPGVPHEMEYMMENVVLPYLRDKFDLRQVIKTRTLHTCGIGESLLDARIADLETSSNPTIGLAAHAGQSDIRLTAKADSEAQADVMLDELEARVRERVDEVIFGVDEQDLESVVVGLLCDRGWTLALAEVQAGGLLSGGLCNTDPEGKVFKGAWVLSSDDAWARAGGPSAADPAAARHLAQRVRTVTGAQCGLGVVNLGPENTHLALLCEGQTYERALRFRGHGVYAHTWIASYALDLIRRVCLGLPVSD